MLTNLEYHFIAIGELKLEQSPGNAQIGVKLANGYPWDLEIWQMTEKKQEGTSSKFLKATSVISYQSVHFIEFIAQKCWNRFHIVEFADPVTLKFDRWSKNKTIGQLFYTTSIFRYHLWIQVEVRKCHIGANFVSTPVILTCVHWHWTSALMSPLSIVITPETFMTIRWHKTLLRATLWKV